MYHRGYDQREPVEVRVNPESIQIVSYPGPDASIRPNDLEKGEFVSRRYRNRRIGEFLKELDMTEGRGTGIPKIRAAMKRNGSPRPRFETDESRLWFVAKMPIHKGFAGQPAGKFRSQSDGEVEAQVEAQVNLAPWQIQLMKACTKGEMTGKELLKAAGYATRTGHFKKGLERLLESRLIELTIPDKPNSRLQKYRLTPRGQAMLKSFGIKRK